MAHKVRKRKKIKKKNRRRIWDGERYKMMLFCAMLSLVVGTSASYAWYGARERTADSAPADVMKPYYLNLRNPSDTADLQLSVGNLFPGDVKQIVFCVSNKNNEKQGLDMGVTSFEYSIELIHTENLALEYRIYELIRLEDNQAGEIEVLDIVEENGVPTEYISNFDKKSNVSLVGTDVSDERHVQAGLTGTMPVNAGKYTSYTQTANSQELRLEAGYELDGTPTFDSQYFLLEIDWSDGAETRFEKYEKETDMIYLLVEALQPKPQKMDTP